MRVILILKIMYWNYISLQYDSWFYNDAKTIGIFLNATEIHSVQIIVWQQIKKKYTASFIKPNRNPDLKFTGSQ